MLWTSSFGCEFSEEIFDSEIHLKYVWEESEKDVCDLFARTRDIKFYWNRTQRGVVISNFDGQS